MLYNKLFINIIHELVQCEYIIFFKIIKLKGRHIPFCCTLGFEWNMKKKNSKIPNSNIPFEFVSNNNNVLIR